MKLHPLSADSFHRNLGVFGPHNFCVIFAKQSNTPTQRPTYEETISTQTMSVVGVDFGAKHAVIAAAGRGGVDVILNGNSQRLNP